MDRDLLAHFPVVVAVARRGGFATAASTLGMSASTVSHAIKTVEDRLGVALFARTTRSVALTEAGKAFVSSIGPALTEIEEAIERLQAAKGRVTGVLKLNSPRAALPIVVTPIVVEMTKRHPDLVIEITTEDGLVDIVAAGFDAGIRLGEMIADDMIAVRLSPPFKAVMVAAPAYLRARGTPQSVGELAEHNCIGFKLLASDAVYAWDLQIAGQALAVDVRGSARVSDPLYAKQLALESIGIAYLFEPLVREDLRRGTLKQILPSASVEEPGLFLYFPRRSSATPKLRAFVDVARSIQKSMLVDTSDP